MTHSQCPPESTLFDLAGSPFGDARRAHADACPICAAKLAAYEGFMRGDAPAGSRPDEARRDLTAFVEREVVASPRTPRSAAAEAEGARRDGGIAARVAAWWTRGPRRSAVAFAALALVTAASLMLMRGPGGEVPLMRGDPMRGDPFIETGVARFDAGRITLSWPSVSGAERYEVEILSDELDVLATHTVTDTSLAFETPPSGDQTAAPRYWRVTASGGGRDIARSRPTSLPHP